MTRAITAVGVWVVGLGVLLGGVCGCENGADGTEPAAPAPAPAAKSDGSATAPDASPKRLAFEAESVGSPRMPRSNASGQRTVWLHAGESLTFSLAWPAAGSALVTIRYSNDGPADTLAVLLDGTSVGSCATVTTGSWGYGWNAFAAAGVPMQLSAGTHTLTIKAVSSDAYGVEVDRVDVVPEG